MSRTFLLLSLLAVAFFTAGCEPEPELVTDLPNVAGGNPLVPEQAMYPFPSDLYLVADSATETGRRVEFPAEVLPADLLPEMWGADDGYSRIPALLTWFAEGIDPASLPDPTDVSATTRDDASVLLVEEGSWTLIPALAELDANARGPFEQALIIRPHRALAPATGYAVLLRSSLRDASGAPLEANRAFEALRDGLPTDSAPLEAQRADFAIALAAAEAHGIPTGELVQAWTFHTRSEEQVVGPLLAMQDTMASFELPPWTLHQQVIDGDDAVLTGSFSAPNFLDEDTRIRLDADGEPIQQGVIDIDFHAAIPETVDGARPVICFGHGFFSGKEEVDWGAFGRLRQETEMSAIAIDFRGFAEIDVADTASILGGNLGRVPEVIDRQVQNVAHFTLLARLVKEQLAAEVEVDFGAGSLHPFDPDAVHYMGISNGGTQGLTIMATSPMFDRGVLVVPGGGWTHMLQRAVQWNEFGPLLEEHFDGPLDLQLTVALLQPLFDRADSLNYVEHVTEDRYDGREGVRITLHEAVEDSQVANMVTEWVARTADIPVVVPSPRDLHGLPSIEAAPPDGVEVPSAMFVYDLQVEPNPTGNIPPEVDNDAHRDVRDLDSYFAQVGRFLEDGRVVQVCDGACDPE
jgi:hypothetical protein